MKHALVREQILPEHIHTSVVGSSLPQTIETVVWPLHWTAHVVMTLEKCNIRIKAVLHC